MTRVSNRLGGRAGLGSALLVISIGLLGSMSMLQRSTAETAAHGALVVARPAEIAWDQVPRTPDGRQRVVLWGNPEQGGDWVYRIRVEAQLDVPPHTHPVDEYITVIEGTWYLGIGDHFDASRLATYPAGSFVRIPAGLPHFVRTGEHITIIQSSGTGPFRVDPVHQ